MTVKDPCNPTQVIVPAITGIQNEIFVKWTAGFSLPQNISSYCGPVTYTFEWVSASQGVQAAIDVTNQYFEISSNSQSQAG